MMHASDTMLETRSRTTANPQDVPRHEFNLELTELAKIFPGAANDIRRLVDDEFLNSLKLGGAVYVDSSEVGIAFMNASTQENLFYHLFERDWR